MCFGLKNYDSKTRGRKIGGEIEQWCGKTGFGGRGKIKLMTLERKNWGRGGVELENEIGVEKSEFWERGDAGKRGTEWNQETINR